jgi:hypothetical protein
MVVLPVPFNWKLHGVFCDSTPCSNLLLVRFQAERLYSGLPELEYGLRHFLQLAEISPEVNSICSIILIVVIVYFFEVPLLRHVLNYSEFLSNKTFRILSKSNGSYNILLYTYTKTYKYIYIYKRLFRTWKY